MGYFCLDINQEDNRKIIQFTIFIHVSDTKAEWGYCDMKKC